MRYLTLIFLITASGLSLAQVPAFKYTGDEFSPEINKWVTHHNKLHVYVRNYMSEKNFEFHNTLCNSGIALLKFKFGPGGVTEIACTKASPQPLISVLKEAIKASEKYWVLDNSNEERLYLMPFIYNYRKIGCTNQIQDALGEGMYEFDDGSSPFGGRYILLQHNATTATGDCFGDFDRMNKKSTRLRKRQGRKAGN